MIALLKKSSLFLPFGDMTRIFYEPLEGVKSGFKAQVISVTAYSTALDNDPWHKPETEYEVIFDVVAYFDGIRHLNIGHEETGNFGSLHYPEISKLVPILLKLRELETKYCLLSE
jgi:hypothetical protein